MTRLRDMRTGKRHAQSTPGSSKILLTAAYGLVVLLSIGVLGGYLMFGKDGPAAPGTAVLVLPRAPAPDTQVLPDSNTGTQQAMTETGGKAETIDWDKVNEGLGNILLAPSSVSAADVAGASIPAVVEPPVQTAALPAPSSALLPAWRRYAVAPPLIEGKPMIAIVIDDVGEDQAVLDRLMAIDAPLTLSFFAWADDIKVKTAKARQAGFELMVHVPMEPVLPKDPGPQALLEGLGLSENRRRLTWHLDQFGEFVGFNNHMGSLVTADPELMTMVMNVVREQGLLYVDSRTTPKSIAGSIARRTSLPTVDRDVFLDDQDTSASIDEQLSILERKAEKYGRALAIGHARSLTIDRLEEWIPKARQRGFVVVPVSTIIRASMG